MGIKILTVYLDDYDKPLIGRAALNESDVREAVDRLTRVAGEDYVVEVSDPDTVEEIMDELYNLNTKTGG